MKRFLAFIALAAAAMAAEVIPESGLYVDLYANVFKDGQNLNRKAGDYIREYPAEATAMDAALTDVALRGREYIAAAVAAKEAEKQAAIAGKEAEKQALLAARDAYIEKLKAQLSAAGLTPVDP